jgi:Holliday junction resolvase
MNHREKVEFDIVLENGNSVAIIEVKNRIRANFVKKLAEERIKEFRKYFPEYKGYDAYLGIAGFSFSKDVLEEAQKYGVGIIRQVGDGIEVDATGLRAYR